MAKEAWARNQGDGTDLLLFDNPDMVKPGSAQHLSTVYADGEGTVTVSSLRCPAAYRRIFLPTIREYEVGHTE